MNNLSFLNAIIDVFMRHLEKEERPLSQKAHSQFLEKRNIISDNLLPGHLNYTQICMFLFSLETFSLKVHSLLVFV